MAKYNIGPKIGIDGWEDFKNQINKLNTSYKTLTAQTRAVTAQFEANGDEQGKLRATSDLLRKQIDVQRQKMAALEEAIAKASAEYKADSEEVQRLQGVLYDTQATLTGLEGKLKDTEDQLEKTESQMDQAGDEAEDFADQTDDAADSVIDFGDVLKANLLSDAIMSGLRKLADFAKDFASGMIEAAASVEAENAQFAQTFGDLEETAKSSLQAVSDETNIAVTRMQGSYTKIYAFAKTSGADTSAAMDIASRAMVAAADSAAYYDRSIEEVTETIQAFLKGNYANDAALGIAATETTRNTAANKKYAKSFNELSESQKVDVLLSMVEAGNEASGAIGQAARESEAWENVTGELSEAWRQLQAKAGAPVLKKIIPVIGDITSELEKVANSSAFDALANGIGNTLGWVLENSGAILSALASITAAIVAFKVASTAAKTVDTLTQSLKAMMLAVSANPIALAVSAVAGLVAAIATAPQPVSEATDRINALSEATAGLSEAATSGAQNITDSVGLIDVTASKASEYVDALERLEKQGLDSAEAQSEYNGTIELLKSIMPDLNVQLDEQTGLIQGGAAGLREQIAGWKDLAKAQVYAEKYKEAFEEVADAEVKMAEAQAELDKIKSSDAYKRWTEQLKALEVQLQNGLVSADDYTIAVAQINSTFKDFRAVRDYEAAIIDAKKTMAESEPYLESLEDGVMQYSAAASDAAGETAELTGEIQEVNAQSFSDLEEEYKSLRDEAYSSISQQIGLFEDLSDAQSESFDEMLAALESQATAFANYADNIQIAMERGIDEGLVKQLSDGSKDSMMILQTLVNGTDQEIAELNNSLGRVEEGRQKFSEAAAKLQSDWDAQMEGLENSAREDGKNIVEGLALGIMDNAGRFYAEVDRMAAVGANTFRKYYEINSPSGLMRDITRFIPLGAAEGVERNMGAFERAMGDLADVGNWQVQGLDRAQWRLAEYAGKTAAVRSTETVNLGGIQVHLTVSAPTSAGEQTDWAGIATLVGDEIYRRVERRIAGHG